MNSYCQQLRDSDARYMRDLIKRSRAAFAAMPEYLQRDVARRLEDGAAMAATEIRSEAGREIEGMACTCRGHKHTCERFRGVMVTVRED